MKIAKKQSFSYVYSPKHQSIMSNIEKIHSPFPSKEKRKISPRSSISPTQGPLHTSRSPVPKVSIFYFKKLENFKNNSKIKIGKQKNQKIKETIDVEREVQIKVKKRISQSKYYFDYNQNPFMIKSYREFFQNKAKFQTQKLSKQKTNLVAALNILRQNKKFTELKNRIDKHESSFIFLSNKLNRQHRTSYINYKQKKEQKIKKQRKQNRKSQKKSQKNAKIKDALNQLNKIVQIKESNFFQTKRNRQPFDLFKVVNDPKNIMFLSGGQQLELLRFSFDSWIRVSHLEFNFQVFKNLAHYSRIAAIKHSSKLIPSIFREQNFDYERKKDNLLFDQLILIANGRLISQNLNQSNNYNGEKSDNNSQIQQKLKEPAYKKNQINIETKGNTQLQKVEIQKYMQQGFSQKQKQLIKEQYKYRAKFRDIEISQIEILNNNIFHIPTRNKIEQQKEKMVKNHIFFSMSQEGHDKKIQQKIRRNKFQKDKTEEIKIDQLRELVRRSKLKK